MHGSYARQRFNCDACSRNGVYIAVDKLPWFSLSGWVLYAREVKEGV